MDRFSNNTPRDVKPGKRFSPASFRSSSPCLVSGLLLAATLIACGNPEPLAPADRRLGNGPLQMLQFGSGTHDQVRWPGEQNLIKIAAFPVAHDHITTRPIGLDRAYELRFLPLVQNEINEAARIETRVLVGDKEFVVGSAQPAFLGDPDLIDDARFAALEKTARIDLSPFEGKNIRLGWRAVGLSTDAEIFIGLPQLVPTTAHRPRPDILLACSDAHRVDYAFGDPGRRLMPHLNALRQRATVYSRAYSTASWTLPAIASAFTGKFPRWHRTGERLGQGSSAEKPVEDSLPPGEFMVDWAGTYYRLAAYPQALTTLGERLGEAGYHCVWVMANAFYESSGLGDDLGGIAIYPGAISGEKVTETALKALAAAPADEPLAMLVHTMDVHAWQEDARYPPNPALTDPQAVARDRYGESAANADRHLARLLESWDAARRFDDTLFFFFSDHGEHVHDLDEWDTPFSGHGTTMLEALLHVPLLVHFPKSMALALDGAEIDTPVSLIDLYPTILEAANVKEGIADAQGKSLADLARMDTPPDRNLFADYQLYGAERSSVRRGPFKLMIDFESGEEILIDTRKTSGTSPLRELPDMVVNNVPLRTDLKSEFEKYRQQGATAGQNLRSNQKINPDAIKRLKGLGYLQ